MFQYFIFLFLYNFSYTFYQLAQFRLTGMFGLLSWQNKGRKRRNVRNLQAVPCKDRGKQLYLTDRFPLTKVEKKKPRAALPCFGLSGRTRRFKGAEQSSEF
jgi:hypothetical protein